LFFFKIKLDYGSQNFWANDDHTFCDDGSTNCRIWLSCSSYFCSTIFRQLLQYSLSLAVWNSRQRERSMATMQGTHHSYQQSAAALLFTKYCNNIPLTHIQISLYHHNKDKE
jgi:hypothetical protein